MEAVRVGPRRADPFIPHDPNHPRYTPRLSQGRWEALRPSILEMRAAGAGIADILKALRNHHGETQISRKPLDYHIRKWESVPAGAEPVHNATASHRPGIVPDAVSGTTAFAPEDDQTLSTEDSAVLQMILDFALPNQFHQIIFTTINLPSYEPLRIVSSLWDTDLVRMEGPFRQWAILVHIALTLKDLQGYAEAFDAWFLLLSTFNADIQSDQRLGALLIYAAANCVASAHTSDQKAIARTLVAQLRHWERQNTDCLPSQSSAPDLSQAADHFLEMADWLQSTGPGTENYWTCAYYDERIFRSTGVRRHGLFPKDARRWSEAESTILSGFIDREMLTEALRVLKPFQSEDRMIMNVPPLEMHPALPADDNVGHWCQHMACTAIEEGARPNSQSSFLPLFYIEEEEELELEDEKNNEELCGQVSGMLSCVLPFVMVQRAMEDVNEILDGEGKLQCLATSPSNMGFILQALRRHSIESSPAYRSVSRQIREQLEAATPSSPIKSPVSSNRLVRAAAMVVKSRVFPRTSRELGPEWHYCGAAASLPRDLRATVHGHPLPTQVEQSPQQGPPLAQSYTPSASSGYQSFKGLALRLRGKEPASIPSVRTTSTGTRSSHRSWRFDRVTELVDSPHRNGSAYQVVPGQAMRASDQEEDIEVWRGGRRGAVERRPVKEMNHKLDTEELSEKIVTWIMNKEKEQETRWEKELYEERDWEQEKEREKKQKFETKRKADEQREGSQFIRANLDRCV
jgi:hypothetical protein